MKFTDTARRAIVKIFMEGMSISQISACYTTSDAVIEKMIRIQLRETQPAVPVSVVLDKKGK